MKKYLLNLLLALCALVPGSCELFDEPKDDGIYHYWPDEPDSYVQVGNTDFEFCLISVERHGSNMEIEFSITNVGRTYTQASIFGPDTSPNAYDDHGGEYRMYTPGSANKGVYGYLDDNFFGVYGLGYDFQFEANQTRICRIVINNLSSLATKIRIPIYLNMRTTNGVYDDKNLIHLHWIPVPEGKYGSFTPIK